ncbi:MAG TPA: PEP-CTERM sorting domain-containing protein [Anaerolineae bacterium]|nr:PEP-CTERM sorting domain-containing protein [Anaerolineae bacterium]
MKARWLLLGVSLICLLVLFPASALSQQQRAELHATCGTARVDGVKSPREWDHAGVVAMFPYSSQDANSMIADLGPEGSEWDVSLAQPATVKGWLYAMNDESHLYLAQLMNLDSVVADPLYWTGMSLLFFMDEPDALDGDFEAASCGPPRPGEGVYQITETQQGVTHLVTEQFNPIPQGGVPCAPVTPIPGVKWAMGPGSLFVEWEMDLNASDVDKVGPGDCLLIYNFLNGWVCPQGSDCSTPANWIGGEATWPQLIPVGLPLGMLCLDPCQVEFVPEPGSILLLGSGLMGLAGYATLRWRARE